MMCKKSSNLMVKFSLWVCQQNPLLKWFPSFSQVNNFLKENVSLAESMKRAVFGVISAVKSPNKIRFAREF